MRILWLPVLMAAVAAVCGDADAQTEGATTGVVDESSYDTDPDRVCANVDKAKRESQWCQYCAEHCSRAESRLMAGYDARRRLRATASEKRKRAVESEIGAAMPKAAKCYDAYVENAGSWPPPSEEAICYPYSKVVRDYEKQLKQSSHEKLVANARKAIRVATKGLTACRKRVAAASKAMLDERRALAKTCPLDEILAIPAKQRLREEQARIDDAVSACRARVEQQRSERAKLAADRPLSEIAAIPRRYRLPEEKERLDQAAAARQRLIEQRRKDKKWMRPVLSAAICYYRGAKKAAAREIRTEKRYARKYGGYVDKAKIYDLQTQIRDIDTDIKAVRKLLAGLKTRAQGCKKKLVRRLTDCLPFPGRGDHQKCGTALSDYGELVP